MRIAIIVAMDKEYALVRPLLKNPVADPGAPGTLSGQIGPHSVVLAKCGIGKVNAALRTWQLIDAHHPDLVVNTGVAGGLGNDAVHVGSVVVGARTAYHDVWCGPETQVGTAADCPPAFEAPAELLGLPALANLHKGLIASGDSFIDTPEQVARIRSLYPQALAVDMESAAIAHACHLRGVPFMAIRVVSDTPGREHDNTAQYENFWQNAPAATFNILTAILTQIKD